MKKYKTYCLNLSNEMMDNVSKSAKDKGLSIAAIIRIAISEYLKRND